MSGTRQCKLNVILDIDETFVYYIQKRHLPHSWDTLSNEEQAKYKSIRSGENLLIFRPHCKEFFDFLFAHCDVSLWTWSDEEYATGIAQLILRDHPGQTMHLILPDTIAERSSELHGHSKDLNLLWYGNGNNIDSEECFAECNTVLIDDLPNNTIHPSNKRNSITIQPFALFGEVKDRSHPYRDVSKDTTLLEVITILKKILPIAQGCYEDDERRWNPIFSDENIARAKLSSYLHTIEYSPFKKLNAPPVKAIGAGDSYHFLDLHPEGARTHVGGRSRRRKTRRRSKRV